MKYLLLAVAILTTGCNLTPYVKGGASYQVNRPAGELCKHGICQEPTRQLAKFELGVKYKMENGVIRAAYCHSSEFFRGWPSNDLAEAYSDEFCVSFERELKWPEFH